MITIILIVAYFVIGFVSSALLVLFGVYNKDDDSFIVAHIFIWPFCFFFVLFVMPLVLIFVWVYMIIAGIK